MYIHFRTVIYVASTAAILFTGASAQDPAGDVNQALNRANTLLSQGKYTDAISLYDDVIRISLYCTKSKGIEKDKKNYLSYYKRALSYLGLSRYHAAITDLNSVLAIQPDFSAALVQRGKILAWQGDFVNAVKDLKKAGRQDEFVLIRTCKSY
jgi:DnaJ homolog subfamily C member 3